jgi:hypothetical protein
MAAQLKGLVRSTAWAFNYLPQLDMEEGTTVEEEKLLRKFYGACFVGSWGPASIPPAFFAFHQ